MKTIIVPQNDIDNVEKAIENLHILLKNIEKGRIEPEDVYSYIINITQPLYYLTHRKYKETFWSKIKNSLQRR